MFLAGIWGRFSNPDFCCSNKMSIGNLLDREKKTVPKSWLGKKGLSLNFIGVLLLLLFLLFYQHSRNFLLNNHKFFLLHSFYFGLYYHNLGIPIRYHHL